ncbi:MAG: YggS family pyridoxal phosphate-dependent enzyme [Candidatus Aminicenantes bacterium]|nr:YggS family pyridoxal phosphate-dependent enzyme [Candidatus Aminicenantes bacterium]
MNIKQNYEKIISNVERICDRTKRDPKQIKILGVCKNQPAEKLIEAYECGLRYFGENKTQEAEEHQAALEGKDVTWHFIGKLQKNKINRVLKGFDFIESVDSVKSLEHIHKRVDNEIETFIEINIGEEKNKSGFTIDGLKKALNYISMLNRVKVVGLMTIPPFDDDPEIMRPYFAKMRELKDEINGFGLDNFKIRDLSMGMSNDYEVALEEGATILRIGTALFGRRSI